MKTNLTSLAIRGFKWSYFSAIVNIIMVTAMTAILARLLDPAEFGLIAVANLLLRFATYFTAGIEPTVIQKPDLSQNDIHTAFTISTLVGLGIFLLVYLLAPLSVWMIPAPEIVPAVRAMALILIINGLSMTAQGLLKKELGFRVLAKIEIGSYLAGYCVVGLYLAANGFGIWSLVYASLTQAALTGLLAYVFTRHSCRLSIDPDSRRHLISFGGKSTALGFLEFLGYAIDPLFIGHVLGAAALGLYNRTMVLIHLPVQNITTPLLKVTFPAMSQIQSDKSKLRETYASTITVLTMISIPMSIGIIPAADDLVIAFLGPKWVDAVPILRILPPMIPIALITAFMGSVCTAVGRQTGRLIVQSIFVLLLPILVISAASGGLTAIAYAVVAAHAIRFVALLLLVQAIIDFSLKEFVRCVFPSIVTAVAVYVTISLAHGTAGHLQSLVALIIEIVVGAATLATAIALLPMPTMAPILRRMQSNVQELGVGRHVVSWLLRRYA